MPYAFYNGFSMYISTNCAEVFQLLHNLTRTCYFLFFNNNDHASDHEEISHHVFVCVCMFLLMTDTDHIFKCLLVLCTASFRKYLFMFFAHFKNQIVFCCWFTEILYMFWILTCCIICDLQIFSPIPSVSFCSVQYLLLVQIFKTYILLFVYICFCCPWFSCHVKEIITKCSMLKFSSFLGVL